MAEVVGLLRREHLPQLLLHLGRVLGAVGKPQQAGDSDAVGVGHHHAGGMVHVPQNQVGGLPAHSGELQQVLHGVGDPAAVVPDQHLRGQDNILGLGPEKAGGMDVLLHLRNLRLRQGLQGGEAGVEGGGHLVHPLVGALGGQADGEKQLVVLAVLQGTDPVRVQGLQLLHNGADIFGGFIHSGSPLGCVYGWFWGSPWPLLQIYHTSLKISTLFFKTPLSFFPSPAIMEQMRGEAL